MIDKVLLTGAFEKMGPERVERMLVAFTPAGEVHYCRCALGYAAGYENDPGDGLNRERIAADMTFKEYLAHRLGITIPEADAIERCHFCRGSDFARAFVALANEWLENRPASLRAASRETAGVGECRFGRGEPND